MSGFSPEWLSLREPADHRARDPHLLGRVTQSLASSSPLHVVDLGCGSGSNLRALAPHLPAEQVWRLVDHDEQLLEAARGALSRWADTFREGAGRDLILNKEDRRLTVSFVQADLSAGVDPLLAERPDLVTAAAFFDLVSSAWMDRFVADIAAVRVPLYTVLTYDGHETWRPAHPSDAPMLAAFQAHQATDKGFGRAAGPEASRVLAEAFGRAGFRVDTARSPWRLDARDGQLIAALADGTAEAVAETGRVSSEEIASWRASRRVATSCEIGHVDLFAAPPRGSA